MSKAFFKFLLAAMGSVHLLSAQADESIDASVTLLIPQSRAISQLKFSNSPMKMSRDEKNNEMIDLDGTFNSPKSSLLLDFVPLKTDANTGAFRARIPVIAPVMEREFTVVSPDGEITREKIGIVITKHPEAIKNEVAKVDSVVPTPKPVVPVAPVTPETDTAELQLIVPAVRPWSASFGLGYTLNHYQETSFQEIQEKTLTLKIGGNYRFHESPWSLGANAFGTAAVLSKEQSSYTRFFGFNFRVGYKLNLEKLPKNIAIELAGGGYYATTFGGTGDFGYRDVGGPQIFLILAYLFENESTISSYFKFSPISKRLSLLTLANREIAYGAIYTLPHRSPLGISIDISNLTFGNSSATAVSKSTTLGLNYRY